MFSNLASALSAGKLSVAPSAHLPTTDDTAVRLFGKPNVDGKRRVAVGLARGDNEQQARQKVTDGGCVMSNA